MKQHFQQIDILKGLAIMAVILLHTFSREELQQSYAVFHIWQAVPVFLVIMGLNLGLSYSSKTLRFRHIYTWHYFQKKGLRILLPLLLMYGIALVAGFIWQRLYGEDVYTLGWESFVGVLPVSGKGNYFITLALQSVLFLPFIGYGFFRWRLVTTLLLVLGEVVFLLAAFRIDYFDTERYLYDAAFFRYLSAIALGLWLSVLITSERKSGRWLLLVLAMASGVYLYYYQYQGLLLPHIRPEWQAQQVLTFPYAAFLVYLFMLAFPQQSGNRLLATIASIGKASYHIFLVQVLYFGLLPDSSNPLLNLGTCLLLGNLFYYLESALAKRFSA
ncbi:acyltransferase family protein [Pontibacter roseus]|uniref:acyltransferase family protein n=1 Tax=Pontibacter roseus TaxID=336989 RepID=UPI0003659C28|nr:acyltransferase family protein [Pontibacter roseus]